MIKVEIKPSQKIAPSHIIKEH